MRWFERFGMILGGLSLVAAAVSIALFFLQPSAVWRAVALALAALFVGVGVVAIVVGMLAQSHRQTVPSGNRYEQHAKDVGRDVNQTMNIDRPADEGESR